MKNKKLMFSLIAFLASAAPLHMAHAWQDAWVQLYDGKSFKDSAITINFDTNIPDLSKAAGDNGKEGFGDKASSVKYEIPPGWEVVLYDDVNYQKRGRVLKGSGEIPDLSNFSDKCSSLRWEQR